MTKKARKLPSDGTVRLSVVASGRCTKGLTMFGHHFSSEPVELEVSELGYQKATRICRHGDLLVTEIAGDGSVLAAPPKSEKLEKKEQAGSVAEAPPAEPKKKRSLFSRKAKDDSPPAPTGKKKKRKAADAD